MTTISGQAKISVNKASPVERARGRLVSFDVPSEPQGVAEADLASDVFQGLLRSAELTDAPVDGREANRQILDWAQATNGWKQAQQSCNGNLPVSMATAGLMFEHLRGDEVMQEVLKAQEQAAEEQKKAQEAENQASAFDALNQPEQAAQSRQNAAQHRQNVANIETKISERLRDAKGNPFNQGVMRSITQKAAQAGKEMADVMGGFGVGAGSPARTNMDAAKGFMKALTPKVRQIAKLAGRFKTIGTEARRQRVVEGNYPAGVTRTQDFRDIFPSELALLSPLAGDISKVQKLEYASRGLMGFELREPEMERGPFVGAVDVSGSMNGEREMVSKAVLLGVAQIAKAEGRRYELFSFSSGRDATFGVSSTEDWAGHLRWAEMTIQGGTSFDLALSKAMELLKALGKEGHNADVVFSSDGEGTVSDAIAREWAQFTSETGARLMYVPVARGYGSIEKIADKVIHVSDIDEQSGADLSAKIAVW